MLSPNEFTVGTFAEATPLSLILPRSDYESVALIGQFKGVAMAVILSGQYTFHFFESANNQKWKGLIIPDVRVEVDETSLFDADSGSTALGSVIRTDTQLAVRAKQERFIDQGTAITLHDELAPAGQLRAGFTKWQVVIGEGQAKRVLWSTPAPIDG